jgi:hypothetical protein
MASVRSEEEEFERFYRERNAQELLDVARSYDDLQPAAQQAIRSEFARRGMQPPFCDEVAADDQHVEALELRKLITIERFRDLSEAIAARSAIQSAGIECFLQDENFVRIDWGYSNYVGGIRLQVASKDATDVAAILRAAPPDSSTQPELTADDLLCPRCGSYSVRRSELHRGRALALLWFFSLPTPRGELVYMCDKCGCRWTDDEQ